MAFQAEQKIKADILRSLSTEQLFRLLSDSDLNVLMKTLGLLRNLLSTRPVSKITRVSRLTSLAYTLQSTALPLCSLFPRPSLTVLVPRIFFLQNLIMTSCSESLWSKHSWFVSVFTSLDFHLFLYSLDVGYCVPNLSKKVNFVITF